MEEEHIERPPLEREARGALSEDARRELEGLSSRLGELEKAVGELPDALSRLSDLEVLGQHLVSLLRREAGIRPLPPKNLQVRVIGRYTRAFPETCYDICDDLDAALSVVGRSLKDFRRILDWGCGCGRIIRAFRTLLPDAELHGTDIDPEAIEWLNRNYAGMAEFRVSPHHPPTSYADATFDFVLGLSVVTHLPEDMQFEWLWELERITAPGGYAILTTSGENNYRNLPAAEREILETRGFLYSAVNYGQSISLPDFYQNAFHAVHYVRREWSRVFDVVEIRPAGMENHQDVVLLRKRG